MISRPVKELYLQRPALRISLNMIRLHCYAIHEYSINLKKPHPHHTHYPPHGIYDHGICMTNLLFHLICNMTTFRKKYVLTTPQEKSKLFASILSYVSTFVPLCYLREVITKLFCIFFQSVGQMETIPCSLEQSRSRQNCLECTISARPTLFRYFFSPTF